MRSELQKQYKEFKKPKVKPVFTLKATSIDDFRQKFEALKQIGKYYSR